MMRFFVAAETVLFDFRFSSMSYTELCKLFRLLDAHIRSSRANPSLYSVCTQTVLDLLDTIKRPWKKWKYVVEKYLQGSKECFYLPFHSVLILVAKREVTLQDGIAAVPVSRLRQVVTSFFRQMLEWEVKNAQKNFHTEDERIIDLIRLIKACTINIHVFIFNRDVTLLMLFILPVTQERSRS